MRATLPAGPGAAQEARALARASLCATGMGEDDVNATLMVVHELVENAIQHGLHGPEHEVRVECDAADGALRVRVANDSLPGVVTTHWSHPPTGHGHPLGRGRGLRIVTSLCSSVEVELVGPSVVVTATVATTGDR
ncbi:ATP-binding protein [Nocardioides sp.]|uniref:ATP-binding protein n=1 Tax=Nocardioides sp. TaxID=35761 RepID=UPI0027181F1A|nr:ATP-binding protein [Nocardioides sp.]MDO9457592.1 ATP-binding protein [Nocardioides sp.]